MSFSLTIAGVAKDIKAKTLRISITANGRATAGFTVNSTDGTYRPALDAEVIITKDSVRLFAGLLDRPSEQGLAGGKGIPAISTAVTASDYNVYPDRRYVKADYPDQTLSARLTSIVSSYLSVYGVTLDGAQVTGPTIAARSYNYVLLSEVLNETCTLTQASGEPFMWRIDAFKALLAFKPSTVSAPFNLIGNTLSDVLGDVTVETARDKRNGNRIIIKVPKKDEKGRTESFTGDGSTDEFTLQYTPYAYRVVTVNGTSYQTVTDLSLEGTGAAMWVYDPTTNVIRRDLSLYPDLGVPGVGETVAFNFDGTWDGTAIAEDASATTNPIEHVIQVEDVPPDTTIQELAESYLAQSLTVPKTVKYRTRTAGIRPGQTQTVTIPRRNLNTSIVITDVNITEFGSTQLVYEVTGIIDAGTNLNKGYRDTYKQWNGDKIGASTVGASGPITTAASSAGPGGPNRSVQYNDDGRFGGDADYLYYKTENSVVCGGGGSSITAVDFESCQVFGYDNHITDP